MDTDYKDGSEISAKGAVPGGKPSVTLLGNGYGKSNNTITVRLNVSF